MDSTIAPARARQLKKLAEADAARAVILAKVEAGDLDTTGAAEQLGVTKARVNQLLRRRRTGDPHPLTTTMIAKLDSPPGRKICQKRAATIEPVFAQVKHSRGIQTTSYPFHGRGMDAEDVDQVARLGLRTAVLRFGPPRRRHVRVLHHLHHHR